MKFKTLQENLRKILWTRIEEGQLTGLRLAAQTGFKQAHISNFLNRKRGLSTDGIDKVLQVQHLSVLDLLDPADINQRASIMPASDEGFDSVALVEDPRQPRIMRMKVKEIFKFKKRFLNKLRPQMEGDRRSWERFVVIRIKSGDRSMYPRLPHRAQLLVDRHYNSLKPYSRNQSNIYAINQNGHCTVKYVESAGHNLLLRPHDQSSPVEIIPIDAGKRPSDYLIGRICHISADLN